MTIIDRIHAPICLGGYTAQAEDHAMVPRATTASLRRLLWRAALLRAWDLADEAAAELAARGITGPADLYAAYREAENG